MTTQDDNPNEVYDNELNEVQDGVANKNPVLPIVTVVSAFIAVVLICFLCSDLAKFILTNNQFVGGIVLALPPVARVVTVGHI